MLPDLVPGQMGPDLGHGSHHVAANPQNAARKAGRSRQERSVIVMSRPRIVTWGVRGAAVAVVCSLMAGLTAAILPGRNMGPEGSLSWFLIESFDAVAEVGLVLALLGVHARQRHRADRLGTAGAIITVGGTVLLIVSTVMWLLPMTDGVLLDILFNGALIFWLVGFPLLGIATWRAGVLPRWAAGVILGFIPFFVAIFFLVDYWGEVRAALALPWLAFGAMLLVAPRVSEIGASAEDRRVEV
jgi:hypothetical protein